MPDINIIISDKVAAVQGAPCIICGNSDYTAVFTFDAAWDGYKIKTARFVFTADGEQQYTEQVFEGNSCPVPVLSGITEVYIGVYAGNLRTTTPARVHCKQSILCGDPVHVDPPADVYNQLLQLLNEGKGKAAPAALVYAAITKGITAEAIKEDDELETL